MRRFNAFTGLLLSAYFAVAGAWHHHAIPKLDHGHVGLCSIPASAPALESCAICKAAGTMADVAASAISSCVDGPRAQLVATIDDAIVRTAFDLLTDPRGPPIV
jgi:hypothetical protein